MFFNNVFKIILNGWNSYDLLGKSNLSFQVEAEILNLLLWHADICNKYLNYPMAYFY